VVFAALTWLFVGLVVLQVFYAGTGLLGGAGMAQHVEFGYAVAMFPLLMVIAGAIARAGRMAWWSAGLLLLAQVQTILPWFREDVPFVAALHPVNALAVFWVGLLVARQATAFTRQRVAESDPVRVQPTAT
jgi:hypothetical protein